MNDIVLTKQEVEDIKYKLRNIVYKINTSSLHYTDMNVVYIRRYVNQINEVLNEKTNN